MAVFENCNCYVVITFSFQSLQPSFPPYYNYMTKAGKEEREQQRFEIVIHNR